ncbi:hypothetical protein QR680_011077 [Steinernema hermaphroditum]|uniref:Uncharacterized protein n=1 Tax=Steinernema hermaphroditum TaxID=289476 RepID=A0AA39IST0_9BILA|nr:hypothetical protein QR680_011077 [Steinernema hermaphroditum]
MIPLHIVTGVVYLSLISICLPLHLFILWIFVSTKELRSNMAYMIMVNLGVYECVELIMTTYDGVATLFQMQGNELSETIVGGLNSAAWDTHGPVILILSLNRLNAFLSTPKKGMFVGLLVLGWLYFAAKYAINIAFNCCYFTPSEFIWNFRDSSLMNTAGMISYVIIIGSLLISLVAYFIIFGIMVSKRKSVSFLEVRLLIQSIVIFLSTALTVTVYNYGVPVLPESPYTVMAIGIMNILNGGVNPVMYLTLNPTIRQHFFRKLTLERNITNSAVVSVRSISGKCLK